MFSANVNRLSFLHDESVNKDCSRRAYLTNQSMTLKIVELHISKVKFPRFVKSHQSECLKTKSCLYSQVQLNRQYKKNKKKNFVVIAPTVVWKPITVCLAIISMNFMTCLNFQMNLTQTNKHQGYHHRYGITLI